MNLSIKEVSIFEIYTLKRIFYTHNGHIQKQFCVPILLLLIPIFFRFVSKQFCLFRLFRYGSETPKRTETNQKNNLLVS
jgi:hypothetical protein